MWDVSAQRRPLVAYVVEPAAGLLRFALYFRLRFFDDSFERGSRVNESLRKIPRGAVS